MKRPKGHNRMPFGYNRPDSLLFILSSCAKCKLFFTVLNDVNNNESGLFKDILRQESGF